MQAIIIHYSVVMYLYQNYSNLSLCFQPWPITVGEHYQASSLHNLERIIVLFTCV